MPTPVELIDRVVWILAGRAGGDRTGDTRPIAGQRDRHAFVGRAQRGALRVQAWIVLIGLCQARFRAYRRARAAERRSTPPPQPRQAAIDRIIGRRPINIPINPDANDHSILAPKRLTTAPPTATRPILLKYRRLVRSLETHQPAFHAKFPNWVRLATPVKTHGRKHREAQFVRTETPAAVQIRAEPARRRQKPA